MLMKQLILTHVISFKNLLMKLMRNKHLETHLSAFVESLVLLLDLSTEFYKAFVEISLQYPGSVMGSS